MAVGAGNKPTSMFVGLQKGARVSLGTSRACDKALAAMLHVGHTACRVDTLDEAEAVHNTREATSTPHE